MLAKSLKANGLFCALMAALLTLLSTDLRAQSADVMPLQAPRDGAFEAIDSLLRVTPEAVRPADAASPTADGDALWTASPYAMAADSLSWATDSAQISLPWPLNVTQRLDSLLLDSVFLTSQVGLMVYDLTADSALYSHNERQLMRPASTMKLVTAIAALDRLGGNHRLRTTLSYRGELSGGTLRGDLCLVGGFDPLLDASDMAAFAGNVRAMGVKRFEGRIVADKSMTDTLRLGEGWCWDDDNPVLSPLTVGGKDNAAARFARALADAKIEVVAQCIDTIAPRDAQTISSRSHSIDQVLLPMMKQSDNHFAEAVFYQLAAAAGERPATARHARRAIQRLLGRLGLRAADYRIADGSGLSLYNYVTPEMEVRLLRHAYLRPEIRSHLVPALPIAADDGTLAKRMRGTWAADNVRAKTGSVACVSSLAGYCKAANGHMLCFAIINQGMLRGARARQFQDRVCDALCRP